MKNIIYEWVGDMLPINNWKSLKAGEIPRWIIRKAVRYYNRGCNKGLQLIVFGDHYIYKVLYEPIEQGHVEFHYYKRKKN